MVMVAKAHIFLCQACPDSLDAFKVLFPARLALLRGGMPHAPPPPKTGDDDSFKPRFAKEGNRIFYCIRLQVFPFHVPACQRQLLRGQRIPNQLSRELRWLPVHFHSLIAHPLHLGTGSGEIGARMLENGI